MTIEWQGFVDFLIRSIEFTTVIGCRWSHHCTRIIPADEAIDRLIGRLSSQSVRVVRLSVHCGLLGVVRWVVRPICHYNK